MGYVLPAYWPYPVVLAIGRGLPNPSLDAEPLDAGPPLDADPPVCRPSDADPLDADPPRCRTPPRCRLRPPIDADPPGCIPATPGCRPLCMHTPPPGCRFPSGHVTCDACWEATPREQTDKCKNITLPQTLFAGGKNLN